MKTVQWIYKRFEFSIFENFWKIKSYNAFSEILVLEIKSKTLKQNITLEARMINFRK
jgi:hypothetical protein